MGKLRKSNARRKRGRRDSDRWVIHLKCGGSGWITKRGRDVPCSCNGGYVRAGRWFGK